MLGRAELKNELTLTLLPGPYYGERRFRLIYYGIGPDSFAERLEMSEGARDVWRLMHRQRFERVSASADLQDYCG